MNEHRLTAGEAFTVSALDDGQVRLVIAAPGGDVELTMEVASAQWLAWKLACASRLPWPPPVRIERRTP